MVSSLLPPCRPVSLQPPATEPEDVQGGRAMAVGAWCEHWGFGGAGLQHSWLPRAFGLLWRNQRTVSGFRALGEVGAGASFGNGPATLFMKYTVVLAVSHGDRRSGPLQGTPREAPCLQPAHPLPVQAKGCEGLREGLLSTPPSLRAGVGTQACECTAGCTLTWGGARSGK